MDELAKFNKERWEDLAKSGISFSRPFLNLKEQSAREVIDPQNLLGDVSGRDVLCLAASGGQQSVAFAMLGANVTVIDISETQISRDREAAEHYGFSIETHQGDMRDLSRFADDSFDIVWHAHSINFVPDARQVLGEVARVIRNGGMYSLACHNPFSHGVDEESWDGTAFKLKDAYADAEITHLDPHWTFDDIDGQHQRIVGPREFRHTLSTLVNGLVEQGFVIRGFWEDTGEGNDLEPGSWDHFMSVAAPYFTFVASYRPEVFA